MREIRITVILIAAALVYSCDDGTPVLPESDWEYYYQASSVYVPTADFWFNTPDEGWAVCGDKVLRYDGARWREVIDFNPAPAEFDIYCEAIAATGPNDVWVGGSLEWEYPFETGTLLHYDGKDWNPVAYPHRGPYQPDVHDLFFTSPDAGWLACNEGILYYDGVSWTRQCDYQTWSLAMAGPADGWALAAVGLRDDVLRWDGSTWTPQHVGLPFVPDALVTVFEEIILNAPNDVWVVGSRGPYYRGLLFHFDGTRWAEVTLPEGTPPLAAAAFDSRKSGWVFSDAENVGVKAWRLRGTRITPTPLPENNWHVKACAAPAPGEAWVMSFPNPNLNLWESRILRYTGGE